MLFLVRILKSRSWWARSLYHWVSWANCSCSTVGLAMSRLGFRAIVRPIFEGTVAGRRAAVVCSCIRLRGTRQVQPFSAAPGGKESRKSRGCSGLELSGYEQRSSSSSSTPAPRPGDWRSTASGPRSGPRDGATSLCVTYSRGPPDVPAWRAGPAGCRWAADSCCHGWQRGQDAPAAGCGYRAGCPKHRLGTMPNTIGAGCPTRF